MQPFPSLERLENRLLLSVTFKHQEVYPSDGGDCKMAADFDGDGKIDLAVGGSKDLAWYNYPGLQRTVIAQAPAEFTTDGQAADINGDGSPDIVIPAGNGDGNLLWYQNPRPGGNPSDGCQWVQHVIGSTGGYVHDLRVADFDGNGRLDVAARNKDGQLMIFLQMGPDDWQQEVFDLGADVLGSEGLACGDIAGDGRSDLVVRGAWLQNPGGSAAIDPDNWVCHDIGNVYASYKAIIADINGDGENEVVYSCAENTGDVMWFGHAPGDPTGDWTEHLIAANVSCAHTLQAGDIDGDGTTDLLVGQMNTSADKEIAVYYNADGQGDNWTKQVVDDTGIHNGFLVDLGHDGRLDIFGSNYNGSVPGKIPVEVWLNEGTNPNPPPVQDTTPPTSSVTAATYSKSTGNIHLTWSGKDDTGGSGLAGYDILVSVDGGTPQTIFDHTTKTSGYYAAQTGHTYDFYSVAYDKAGNAEDLGPAPDQTVDLPAPPRDTAAPTSSVTSAKYNKITGKITLTWSGKDNTGGSGLACYDILVSVDGGTPQTIFDHTTKTSGYYAAQTDHTYDFYSVAYDKAGNSEQIGTAPDQTIDLIFVPPADTIPPTSSITRAAYDQSGSTIQLSWSGRDNSSGSGLAGFDILVSIDGGSPETIFSRTTETAGDYAVSKGHTYGFYSVAYDNAGNAEAIGDKPDITVNLTGTEEVVLSGLRRRYSFTDADGTPVTIKFSGPGTATLQRDSAPGSGRGDITRLAIEGGTNRTAVSITAKGGTAIGDIIADGDLRSITAPAADLLGDVEIAGGLASLKLRDIAGPSSITIGPAGSDKTTASLSFGRVRDLELSSRTPIRTLSAAGWLDGDGRTQTITAPAISTLAIKGDVQNTVIDLQNGQFTPAVKSLTVTGWLSDSRVLTDGDINNVRLGGLADSDIFAGVNAGVTGLPDPTSDIDLLDGVWIKKLSVTGAVQNQAGYSTINSNIAAPILGSITLSRLDSAPGTAWGLAAHTLTRLTCIQAEGKYVWPKIDGNLGAFDVAQG